MGKKEKVTKTKKIKMVEQPVLCRKGVSDNWKKFVSVQPGVSGKPLFIPHQSTNNPPISNTKPQNRYKTPNKNHKVVAIDCEMVADEAGQNMLARVSIVDYNLNCIYDKYVKPESKVGDYRTRFSGIRPKDIANGEQFAVVQKEVKELLRNKILVGHSIRNDFNVLRFGHHSKLIRDTSYYKPFRAVNQNQTPSLKKLSEHFLDEKIQKGEHSSVEDAAAAMKLYKKFKNAWEASLLRRNVAAPTTDESSILPSDKKEK